MNNTLVDINDTLAIAVNTGQWHVSEEKAAVQQILDAMQCMALIVNQENHLVIYNRYSSEFFGMQTLSGNQVLQPGNFLFCNYVNKTAGGCGSGKNCRYCELMNIIVESRNSNQKVTRECRIMASSDNPVLSYDLQVQAAPLQIGNENNILVSMIDISHEKRRKNLERIFFHDLINYAGGMKGLVDCYIEDNDPVLLQNILQVSHTILEEIFAQRDLAAAENGDLQVLHSPVNSHELLRRVCDSLEHHTVATGKNIVIDSFSQPALFFSDARLLKRILGNMLKNALEASESGETVVIGSKNNPDSMEFWVTNSAVMSDEVQAQVFQRSYSTKGNDRGLGTYSMRMLTERYLKGSINFDSAPGQGTSFRIKVPKEFTE